MPRAPRADEAGQIYHALNRGNARNKIFFKQEDFEAFERIVAEGLDQFPAEKVQATREGIIRNGLVHDEKALDAVMFSLIPGDFC